MTTAVRDQLLLVLGYENKFNIPRDIPTDPLLENEHKVNILRGILRPKST